MSGLIEVWLVEFLVGMGRLFLHPLLYLMMGFSVLLGYFRVKRERRLFHVRTYEGLHELKSLFPHSILLGLALSIVTVLAGVVVPFGSIVLISIATVAVALIGRLRLLSPVYTIGLTFFAIIFLSQFTGDFLFIADFKETSLPALSMLLAMLVLLEGILIIRKGYVKSSPTIMKSKRGYSVGAHLVGRLWLVPIFLLVPGEAISLHFEWWPIFTLSGEPYTLFLVPFSIGFYQKIKSMLPVQATSFIGKRVIILGSLLVALSIGSIYYPIIAIMAVSFAIVCRELIALQFRVTDDSSSLFYTKRKNGLLVLGILPKSPADKMGLQVGEVISKVNGTHVLAVNELYQALQKNRAFCKLEVIGLNGEMRFVQRALYDGEHHELGVLFVTDDKVWETEAI